MKKPTGRRLMGIRRKNKTSSHIGGRSSGDLLVQSQTGVYKLGDGRRFLIQKGWEVVIIRKQNTFGTRGNSLLGKGRAFKN